MDISFPHLSEVQEDKIVQDILTEIKDKKQEDA